MTDIYGYMIRTWNILLYDQNKTISKTFSYKILISQNVQDWQDISHSSAPMMNTAIYWEFIMHKTLYWEF